MRCLLVAAAITTLGSWSPAQAEPGPRPVLADQMPFVQNHGQWPGPARFRARRGPATAWFVPGGWVFALEQGVPAEERDPLAVAQGPATTRARGVAVRMQLAGSIASPVATDPLPGVHHYLLGADQQAWVRDVPGFAQLRYADAYPGVDVVVRDNGRFFEYDLELAAGADPERVAIDVEGATRLRLGGDGRLIFDTDIGEVFQTAPISWQVWPDGTRRQVRCQFRLLGPSRYGFAVLDRMPGLATVIDPGIDWATPLGGSGEDWAFDMSREPSGLVTMCGDTTSIDFPFATGGYQRSLQGVRDAWVARVDTAAGRPLWTTYLGGTDDDIAWDLDVAANLDCVVTGYTRSAAFPTTPNGLQPWPSGAGEAFVARLDATGSTLLYGTYFGGPGDDWGCTVAVGAGDVLTLAGYTESPVPTTSGAYQTTLRGLRNAFLCRIDPAQPPVQQLVWSTLLGGDNFEGNGVNSIAVFRVNMKWLDMIVESDRITLVGVTYSPLFPTTQGAYDRTYNGIGDVFVAQLDATGSSLLYGSFLGGDDIDGAWRVRRHPDRGYVLCGVARRGFPVTPNAYQTVYRDPGGSSRGDGLIAWFAPGSNGAQDLIYSTYLGGLAPHLQDALSGLDVDGGGIITVGGFSDSSGVPTTPGAFRTQQAPAGGLGRWHTFVARLQPAGRGARDLHYLSYVYESTNGGGVVTAIDVDELGVATCGGFAIDPPVLNPLQLPTGTDDAMLVRIDMLPATPQSTPPAGVDRYGTSTAACGHPIYQRVDSLPVQGNARFTVSATGAPPNAVGALFLGNRDQVGTPFLNLRLHLVAILPFGVPAATDNLGFAELLLAPLPASPLRISAQWVFVNTPQCPGHGPLSASHGMEVFY